ncbi:MAG: hypothetical protein ACRC6V_09405 [Bacteroidales bacterium]
MVTTHPLGYTHRDMMSRVIRLNDYVVWANKKQGSGMVVCTVIGCTKGMLRLERQDNGKLTNAHPENLVVITAQVERNIIGNVGANMDLEATR